jgi:hypothetical protein
MQIQQSSGFLFKNEKGNFKIVVLQVISFRKK